MLGDCPERSGAGLMPYGGLMRGALPLSWGMVSQRSRVELAFSVVSCVLCCYNSKGGMTINKYSGIHGFIKGERDAHYEYDISWVSSTINYLPLSALGVGAAMCGVREASSGVWGAGSAVSDLSSGNRT